MSRCWGNSSSEVQAWIFTKMRDGEDRSSTLYVYTDGFEDFDRLRAGFAVIDHRVPGGDAAETLQRLRERASRGRVTIAESEAAEVSAAISDLNIHLHITIFGGPAPWQHPDPGGWLATTALVDSY
jgi:hypothetical protein